MPCRPRGRCVCVCGGVGEGRLEAWRGGRRPTRHACGLHAACRLSGFPSRSWQRLHASPWAPVGVPGMRVARAQWRRGARAACGLWTGCGGCRRPVQVVEAANRAGKSSPMRAQHSAGCSSRLELRSSHYSRDPRPPDRAPLPPILSLRQLPSQSPAAPQPMVCGGSRWPGCRAAALLLLSALAVCRGSEFQEGDFVPASRRAQFHGVRCRRHLPLLAGCVLRSRGPGTACSRPQAHARAGQCLVPPCPCLCCLSQLLTALPWRPCLARRTARTGTTC